ncbi:MAG: 50S ribosomal protein L31e [Candidatus Bathyarchaeia archaeon]
MAEEGPAVSEERIVTMNLKELVRVPRRQRAPRAIKLIRAQAKRIMKAEEVKVSNEVNEELWSKGIEKPPRRITVKLVKDEEGRITILPP